MPATLTLSDERVEALRRLAAIEQIEPVEWIGRAIRDAAHCELDAPLPGWTIEARGRAVLFANDGGMEQTMAADVARSLAITIREAAQVGGRMCLDLDANVLVGRRGVAVKLKGVDGGAERAVSWEVAREIADLLDRAADEADRT